MDTVPLVLCQLTCLLRVDSHYGSLVTSSSGSTTLYMIWATIKLVLLLLHNHPDLHVISVLDLPSNSPVKILMQNWYMF